MRLRAAFLASLLALLPSPRAARADGGLAKDCYNEIQLFCKGAAPRGLRACLRASRDGLMRACRRRVFPSPGKTVDEVPVEPPQASEEPAALEARLTKVEGTVYVHTSREPEGTFIAAVEGMPLAAGDLVRTGTDGKAEVGLEGQSVIAVDPGSDLTVGSLAPARTEFDLGLGSLLAKIAKLALGRGMSFRTPTAVAAVRGTELGVAQDEGGAPARVGVFDEGRVAVTSKTGGAAVMLGPGQETSVAPGNPPEAPRALAAFAGRSKDMEAARRRVSDVRKAWNPMTPAARRSLREKISAAGKPLRASELVRAKPSQRQRAAPAQGGKPRQSPSRPSGERGSRPSRPAEGGPARAGEPARAAPSAPPGRPGGGRRR